MSLPGLIELVPPDKRVQAQITVPGSKSITNRALILAALADGQTVLRGALWSEDTQVMTECLQRLGFAIRVDPDAREFCNRTITVGGLGGVIPNAGSLDKPLELFVGNAGTVARFLAAFVCLGKGDYRLSGVERMRSRPQAALFRALRSLGYAVQSENDMLPAVIHGTGPREASCAVDIAQSSQFASALLLSGGAGGWNVRIDGQDDEEMPYVRMTQRLIDAFPKHGGEFVIEADASSASYFLAANWLIGESNSGITVTDYPQSDWQIDAAFKRFFPRRAALPACFLSRAALPACSPADTRSNLSEHHSESRLEALLYVSRQADLGDSIMTAIVMAALGTAPVRFTHLERLRAQECERVAALRTELTRCGARVVEEGETLTVHPGPLHGAEIETYDDHRMAMCFAILGLKIPDMRIKNAACVKKTFPNFFQKLANDPQQGGLGVRIIEPQGGRILRVGELFAE